ncbi:hypothetical protein ACHAQJ_010391 [Trichoderma viride]
MFKLSRRRDHSLQPLTKETADPDAATAAASAFMRGNPAQSLSSAAAAAALRTQPSTPTNVAEISSKRNQRRASSLSSPGGRDRGKKNKLARSPSVSSMSERTFRSPSPGRTASNKKQDVPPVPSISTAKTTATPLRTQNFQTASQKSDGHQQGSWFGAATAQHAYQEKGTESMSKLTPDLPESRSGSVSSSINFSYPRTRTTSYDSHMAAEHDLVYDPNSRRMVPKETLLPTSPQVEDTALMSSEKAKGTKLVKKSHIPQGLADEMRITMPNNIQAKSPLMVTGQSHDTLDSFERESPNDGPSPSRLMPTTATEKLSRERGLGAENPRDWQYQNASQNEGPEVSRVTSISPSLPRYDNMKGEMPFTYAGSSSETSVRSAHFASSADRLVVKHEPPPRSLSPRKSAMKPATSNRGSLSLHSNENLEYPILGTSHPSQEDSTPGQRKSARVSWNDNSTVMAIEPSKFEEADITAASSVHSRQKTYSTVEGSKTTKESPLQQDELMSPRPALPLFGSVRDKKGKEPEERQLVRPRERSLSPQPLPPSNSHTSSSTSKNENIIPIESVKGSSYNREQISRNVANISKYREPLPAIVASTESLGQEGEDVYSSDDERFEDVSTGTEQPTIQSSSRDLLPDSSSSFKLSTNEASEAIPATTSGLPDISNPDTYSLRLMQKDITPMAESNLLPGSFPHDEDVPRFNMGDVNDSITPVSAQPSGYTTLKQIHLIDGNKQEEDSDKDSIYSDAYEDLPEATESGFMSLDAALANPPLARSDINKLKFNANYEGKPSDNDFRADDWERTKAYWKSLTSEERRQLEIEALQETDDDGAMCESVTAKGPTALPDRSGYSSGPDQRKQVYQSRVEHPLPADSASLGTFQDHTLDGLGLRNLSKKDSSKDVQRRNDPMEHANFALIDAQTGHQSLQQSVAAKNSDTATERGLKKLAHFKRSMGSEQRRVDDIRGPTTRPNSLYKPVISTASGPRRIQKHPTDSPIADPTMSTGMKSTLRRRGSDSSESSFIRSRSTADARRGLRMSMRSNSSESNISFAGKKGRKRLTLRSLSPTTSHAQHHSVMPIPSSVPLTENQGRRLFRQNLPTPYTNQSLSRKDEDSTYDDHISDSSDDDLNTTPLTNRSMTGDEYEPAQSKFKHSFTHIYARNNKPPDQSHSTNAGFGSQKHNDLKLRDDQPYDEGDAYIHPDPDHRPVSHPTSTATQEPSTRRSGLISTLMRKRDGHVRGESRDVHDAAPTHNAIQHHNEDVPSTHSSGWPLQNRKGGTKELPVTSPIEEMGRGSAASGSIVKGDLTSDPRQQQELQGSSDPSHANILLSPEPKRKKFNSLRKMFKIND